VGISAVAFELGAEGHHLLAVAGQGVELGIAVLFLDVVGLDVPARPRRGRGGP
jgi:hypothetical protein